MLKKLSVAASSASISLFLSASSVLAQGARVGRGPISEKIEPSVGFATDFGKLINNVLTIIMVIALLLVLLYLVLGGIEWITSGGDKGKTESARNKITAAVIGIIILAASYALVQLVAYVLGFAGFSEAIQNIPQINE